MTVKTAAEIFRDYVVDGVPASGPYNPPKADVRAWGMALNLFPTVFHFGAVGDNITDDSGAFNAALASSSPVIMVPPASYKLASTVNVNSAKALRAAGPDQTLLNSSASGHAISVATGLTGVELNGFTLTRTGVPTSANDGLHFTGITEQARLSELEIRGFWKNFRLCATGYSTAQWLFSDNSYNDGILVTNTDAVAAGLQWACDNLLVQQSNGYGLHFESTFGSTANLGPLTNWWSFANTLGGAYWSGQTTHPINGVRVGGVCFSGSEGGDSIKLDTYGTFDAYIDNVFTEANGLSSTGVNSAAASPSSQGRGFYVTLNNTLVAIRNCGALTHSWSGIDCAANRSLITGNVVRICSQAAFAGQLDGIILQTGNGSNQTVVGNSSKGQRYGLFTNNDNHVIVANDFSENTTGGIGAAGALTLSQVWANKGSTISNLIVPGLLTADPHVVGQVWNSAGTLKVSAG